MLSPIDRWAVSEDYYTLEDILTTCVLYWEGSYGKYLPLVEFSYNNSYHSSIEIATYEAIYVDLVAHHFV